MKTSKVFWDHVRVRGVRVCARERNDEDFTREVGWVSNWTVQTNEEVWRCGDWTVMDLVLDRSSGAGVNYDRFAHL